MGQYRQWLHYREVDHLLRSQLAVSEHELKQLQAQVEILGKHAFFTDNTIFQALIAAQSSQHLSTPPLTMPPVPPEEVATQDEIEPSGNDTREEAQEDRPLISPALFAWGRLPNFDTQVIQETEPTTSARHAQPPQPEEHLLPSNISALIDAYSLTDSRIHVPWWLRELALPEQKPAEPETHPVDQQSAHVDHLVQRWFARWGQQRQQPGEQERVQAQEDQTP